ncbi:MAG: hypothetical protein IIB56_09940 [Planctomycetes bacterium]|nr:hypothetical protein [Planctomycetota bacterium]
MCIKEISEICAGFLTPTIAILAVYIAWQQHKTNTDKLRLNLYDRRNRVFDGLMNLLGHIGQQRDVTDQQLYQFYAATNQSEFLFGEGNISEYLEEIRKKAIDLQYLEKRIKDQRLSQEERKKVVENSRKVFDWLEKQFEVSKNKFRKFLSFKNI